MTYGVAMAADDIEKLLNEINASTIPASQSEKSSSPSLKSSSARAGGRLPFAVASGVVVGGSGAVFGLLFPFFTIIETGLTAAAAAFLTAIVAGPPRWFSS